MHSLLLLGPVEADATWVEYVPGSQGMAVTVASGQYEPRVQGASDVTYPDVEYTVEIVVGSLGIQLACE